MELYTQIGGALQQEFETMKGKYESGEAGRELASDFEKGKALLTEWYAKAMKSLEELVPKTADLVSEYRPGRDDKTAFVRRNPKDTDSKFTVRKRRSSDKESDEEDAEEDAEDSDSEDLSYGNSSTIESFGDLYSDESDSDSESYSGSEYESSESDGDSFDVDSGIDTVQAGGGIFANIWKTTSKTPEVWDLAAKVATGASKKAKKKASKLREPRL